MPWTLEQNRELNEWIRILPPCPQCNGKTFAVEQSLYHLQPVQVNHDGEFECAAEETGRLAPQLVFLPVVCKKCTFVRLYQPHIIGLFKSAAAPQGA
ncbi:MAG: hypothetical protein ACJ8F7_17670 [Gemmataceae bacterium]